MNKVEKKRGRFSFNFALFAIFVILFATIALISPAFRSFDYIVGVMLRNMIEIGMMALPLTLIIVTGGIDLSVGSTLMLSAMVGGMVSESAGSTAGTIAGLSTGLVCGLFNGLLVAKLKINPLVTTLATMYLYMGLARSFSHGDSVYSFAASEALGNKTIGGFPIQIIIYFVLAVVFVLLLHKTTLGRKLFAMGINENAAKFSGVSTDKVLLTIYALSGLVCAVAGMIWIGRFTSVKYDAGTSLNLRVVTIVVLGGTSILGGIGDMCGTIIASLIIATLNSGLTVMNIPIDVQIIVNGIVLVISLLCYAVINKRMRQKQIIDMDISESENKSIEDKFTHNSV